MAVDETDVVRVNSVQSRFYSPDNEVLLKSILATLADLDFAYEHERERVRSSTDDPSLRARVLRNLEAQYQERREPYSRHLTMLQARLIPAVGVREEPPPAREEGRRFTTAKVDRQDRQLKLVIGPM